MSLRAGRGNAVRRVGRAKAQPTIARDEIADGWWARRKHDLLVHPAKLRSRCGPR